MNFGIDFSESTLVDFGEGISSGETWESVLELCIQAIPSVSWVNSGKSQGLARNLRDGCRQDYRII